MKEEILKELQILLNEHRQPVCKNVDCDVCDVSEIDIRELFDKALSARDEEWREKIKIQILELEILCEKNHHTDETSGVCVYLAGRNALKDLINSMK